jgi:hypothetical protein
MLVVNGVIGAVNRLFDIAYHGLTHVKAASETHPGPPPVTTPTGGHPASVTAAKARVRAKVSLNI